jgi:hypothetical protein
MWNKAARTALTMTKSTEACAMEMNLGGAAAAPFGNDHLLGPMMIWPPATGFVERARDGVAAKAAQETAAAICLPDLSGENPFS